ncbi:MAG: substrate-binding domain-containing protein [Luteolibacter sp.]
MNPKRNVLLALTTTHHGFYRGVARFARENNWHLTTDMLYAATIPRGWQGDGIISHVGYWKELADFVRSARCPRVELTMVRKDLGLPYVDGDHRAIGRLAARHFIDRGYRRFAWFPFTNDPLNNERRAGFLETIAAEGFGLVDLPPLHELRDFAWRGNWAKNLGRIARSLEVLPKPAAVFCYNDCAAANILGVCQELGIAVPEQLAIIGVDNDELLCDAVTVPLTSVVHDLEEVGYQGALLLERLMNREAKPPKPPVIGPKGIVSRRSTDMLSVEHLGVARALGYIRRHYGKSVLQVPEIVDAVGMSRRPLEVAFRNETGRTINQEIARIRIEKAKELLCGSKSTIGVIAGETGFLRANHFNRVFRAHVGVSPGNYRKKLKEAAPPEQKRPKKHGAT